MHIDCNRNMEHRLVCTKRRICRVENRVDSTLVARCVCTRSPACVPRKMDLLQMVTSGTSPVSPEVLCLEWEVYSPSKPVKHNANLHDLPLPLPGRGPAGSSCPQSHDMCVAGGSRALRSGRFSLFEARDYGQYNTIVYVEHLDEHSYNLRSESLPR